MKITTPQVYIVLGIVGLLAVYFVGKKALGAAGSAVDAVSPLNQNNVFANTINKVGAALVTEPDGNGKNADGSFTLGGWWYDVTHPQTAQQVRDMSGTVQRKSVAEPATFTAANNSPVTATYDATPQYDPLGNYIGP